MSSLSNRTWIRTITVAALTVVVGLSGIALVAGPGALDPEQEVRSPEDVKLGRGFQPCPSPPCMAPCTFPSPPQVACSSGPGSGVSVTSFTCCCCGGGGNFYRPL